MSLIIYSQLNWVPWRLRILLVACGKWSCLRLGRVQCSNLHATSQWTPFIPEFVSNLQNICYLKELIHFRLLFLKSVVLLHPVGHLYTSECDFFIVLYTLYSAKSSWYVCFLHTAILYFDSKKMRLWMWFQLGFNVRGGKEHHCGIYVSKVKFTFGWCISMQWG